MSWDVVGTTIHFVSHRPDERIWGGAKMADDATYSKKCYPRTSLPGCKGKWTEYEAQSLRNFATAAFSTVPIHLVNIVVALICSNHVDQWVFLLSASLQLRG